MSDKTFNLQSKYFLLIKEGKKIVEGRLNIGKFKNMIKGDIITVCLSSEGGSQDLKEESFKVEILRNRAYKNFEEMLENEGLQNVLPGCDNLDNGVKIYYNIADYKENETKFGVVGLQLKKI